MELYASAALTGMGYALNKERDGLRKSQLPAMDMNETPSMNNMYESDHWRRVRQDEKNRGDALWKKAESPWNTGVVPKPAYASMFSTPMSENNSEQVSTKSRFVQSLTGEAIPVEQFQHNNMQPFFRGSVKQNMDPHMNESRLEAFTGRGDLLMNKQEVAPMFAPTSGLTNVCGMANNADYFLSHTNIPVVRNNDFPIDQIHVGPGLNKGFTATPDGGFQQASTLEYSRPKNVDELRVASKPRYVNEGNMGGPVRAPEQRGLIGEFAKNRPDTFYEQTEDNWLRTTGANTKEMSRGVQIVKPTSRVDSHVQYKGNAQAFVSQPGKGAADDYGKTGVMVYDNERMTTETKTVVSNLTSTVKAIVAPLLDVMKHGIKEYTVDSARPYGNMSAQIPEKPTTYDPVNHLMRTTIKETTIHDTTIANLKGPERLTQPTQDEAKTTIRETLPVEDTTRNISSHVYRVVTYNPDEVARTTIREMTEQAQNDVGYISGDVTGRVGAYQVIDVEVPMTQKAVIADNDYYGGSESKTDFRPRSQDAERSMEVDGTREALVMAAGHTPAGAGAFTSLDPEKVDLESKKLMTDSIAPRAVGNVSRVLQPTAKPIEECEITSRPDIPNANKDWLDPSILNALRDNPYTVSVNPIGSGSC